MTEEIKNQEQKTGGNKVISAILKVILGLVFLALGILAIIVWFSDLLSVIRGSIGLFLILTATIIFAIAKE